MPLARKTVFITGIKEKSDYLILVVDCVLTENRPMGQCIGACSYARSEYEGSSKAVSNPSACRLEPKLGACEDDPISQPSNPIANFGHSVAAESYRQRFSF